MMWANPDAGGDQLVVEPLPGEIVNVYFHTWREAIDFLDLTRRARLTNRANRGVDPYASTRARVRRLTHDWVVTAP